jgi:hypothetical protein
VEQAKMFPKIKALMTYSCRLLHSIFDSLQKTHHADFAFRTHHKPYTSTLHPFFHAREAIAFGILAASHVDRIVHCHCSSQFSYFAALFCNIIPFNSACNKSVP